MELFYLSFGRIFDLLFSSIPITLYMFACTTFLCIIFQVVFLRKANQREGRPLTARHFIWVYVFLFYLMLVYSVTGLGAVWDIGRYESLIRMSEVHLIPFGTFDGSFIGAVPYILNICMTIPLGFLLAFIWPQLRSVKKIALIGFCFALVIELSQLLNRRGSTVDDLLMNTLGAVLGYLLFCGLYALYARSHRPTPAKSYSSPLLRHEPIIYLISSFVGVFLLLGPAVVTSLPNIGFEMTGATHIEDNQFGSGYIKGVVQEISEDSIKINKISIGTLEDGSFIAADSGLTLVVLLDTDTTFELWRTNTGGSVTPVVTAGTSQDLAVNDSIDIYGSSAEAGFLADKIIIWRFDLN